MTMLDSDMQHMFLPVHLMTVTSRSMTYTEQLLKADTCTHILAAPSVVC